MFLNSALDEFWRKIHQAQNPTEIARVKPCYRCELLLRIDFARNDPFSPADERGQLPSANKGSLTSFEIQRQPAAGEAHLDVSGV